MVVNVGCGKVVDVGYGVVVDVGGGVVAADAGADSDATGQERVLVRYAKLDCVVNVLAFEILVFPSRNAVWVWAARRGFAGFVGLVGLEPPEGRSSSLFGAFDFPL